MGFTAPKSEGDFELTPEGTHGAVVQAVIDLGFQETKQWGIKRRVALTFQFPGVFRTDGTPQSITRAFTLSMHKKAKLREFVEGIYGKKFPDEKTAEAFDLGLLLNRACLASVSHTAAEGKTYANVASAVAIPSGMPKPALVGETLLYHEGLSAAEKSAAYQRVPEWLRKKIDEQAAAPTKKSKPEREPGSDDDEGWSQIAA